MTKQRYDAMVDDLKNFHPEDAFIFRGEKFFIHKQWEDKWYLEVADNLDFPCEFTTIKVYDTLDELLTAKDLRGFAIADVYEELEPTDY